MNSEDRLTYVVDDENSPAVAVFDGMVGGAIDRHARQTTGDRALVILDLRASGDHSLYAHAHCDVGHVTDERAWRALERIGAQMALQRIESSQGGFPAIAYAEVRPDIEDAPDRSLSDEPAPDWSWDDPPGEPVMTAPQTNGDRALGRLLTDPELSSYRESLLEQLFCADLIQGCWAAGQPPVELSHAFVDFQGYDIIATCGLVTRHIQLKAVAGKAARWDLHRNLASKPSACCVLLLPRVTVDGQRIDLTYRSFGAGPGQPIVWGDDLRPPPHPRPDAAGQGNLLDGARRSRLNHLRVPARKFTESMGIAELVPLLFGGAPEASEAVLAAV